MRTLKSISFVFLIAASISSFAATEFEDSIPIDTAKILFDTRMTGQVEIYSDIMDEFPPFQVPAALSVLGSVNQGFMLRVILETQSDEDTAIDVIMKAFLLNNWQSMPSPFMGRAQTGFIAPNTNIPKVNQICHDQLGRISINYFQRSSVKYVSLNKSRGFGGHQGTCAQQVAQQTAQQALFSNRLGANGGIRQYMPKMELPSTTGQMPSPFSIMGGGFSGSLTDIETESQLEIEWTTTEVYQHFADQIAEQEWLLDSESSGNFGANGTWTRSPETNMNLIGTLTVLKTGDSYFQLKFRLISSGDSRSSNALIRGIRN